MSHLVTEFRPTNSGLARPRQGINRLTFRRRLFKGWIYRNHRTFALLLHRFRRRVTLTGWLVVVTAIVVGAVGADTNASVGYETFALLGCAILAATVCAPFGRPRLTVERLLPKSLARWGIALIID